MIYRIEMFGTKGDFSMTQVVWTHSFQRLKELQNYARKNKFFFNYEVMEN